MLLYLTATVLGTGSLSGSFYALFTEAITWNNAKANCRSLGAELIKIDSEVENDFIKSTFLTSDGVVYWIGMSDQVQEGTWVWVADGTPGVDDGSVFVNWKLQPQQPNNHNGNQNCAVIIRSSWGYTLWPPSTYPFYRLENYDAEWNDLECHLPFGYICEKSS